jgi:hypothetical protein
MSHFALLGLLGLALAAALGCAPEHPAVAKLPPPPPPTRSLLYTKPSPRDS